MNKRETRSARRIQVNRPETKAGRLRTYVLIATCGLLLVSGFFFAGRQHFSSMDYGMKNSKLRRQVDLLEAEKRRLMLSREVSLTPNELKKAIQKVSLRSAAPEGEVEQVASATREKATPNLDAKLVVKTAAVTPSMPRAQTAALKVTKPTAAAKKAIAAE